MELTAVENAGQNFAHVHRRLGLARNQRVKLLGIKRWFLGVDLVGSAFFGKSKTLDDVPHEFKRVVIVFGKVIGDARQAGVNVTAAKVFSIDFFARRGFDKGWPTEEKSFRYLLR